MGRSPHAALADRGGVARTCPRRDPRGPAGRGGGHDRRRRRRAGPAPARLRSRRADVLRAGRGRVPRRRPARPHPGRPGRASGSATPSGPSGQTVMSADPVDPAVLEGLARNAAADPAAARVTPTSPACRSTASTTPGRCSSGPAPARPRPGSRWAPSPRRSCEQAVGVRLVSHVVAIGAAEAPDGSWPAPGRRRPPRRRPGPLPRPRRERGDGRRDRRGAPRRRHPRGRRRGAGLRPAAGPRQPRALGPPPRLAAGRRPDGHPGDQGRRGRRRLRVAPAGGARRPTTRSSATRTAACGGVRRAPAASRAACRTGEPLRVRAAMKPISTVPRALDTVDVATGEPAQAINQRSDVCAVPAAGIVAEAMVALVLADAVLEKFGGDSRRRDASQRRGLPRQPRGRADRAASAGPGRSAGLGQDAPSRGSSPTGSAPRGGTPTTTSRPATGASIARHLRRPRRGALPRARGDRGRAARWPSTTGCWPSVAARCSTPGTRELLGRTHRRLPRRRASPTLPSGSASTATDRCCSATRGRSGSG